ncbi:hypothetical protein ACFOPQ_09630 [Deinococcus antarcticus]|uniref:Uncharacterized protein n=1 Tax=Deinococcus antarcticus TaxID=1298767 RepID=A0ABV8A717_9DEIO
MLLTDFAFTVIALDQGEKVRDLMEKQRYAEAREALEASSPSIGSAQDEVALLKAVIAICEHQFQEALDLVSATLPFVILDRTMCAFAHWIGAVALWEMDRPLDSAYWCSLATDQARSPAASRLQVGILCFWAVISAETGQFEQAIARTRLALRRARQPHELFHAHFVTFLLYREIDQKKATYHIELAQNLAITPHHRFLVEKPPDLPRPKLLSEEPGRIKVNLLGGTALEVNGARVSATGTPRAALLMAYLIQNDGESIAEVAEQILPPETAIKSADKARSDRAARVRQHLNQARRLLGDPSAVVCKGGRLWLGRQYDWESDLRLAVIGGKFHGEEISPLLACPWLEELTFTLGRSHRRP